MITDRWEEMVVESVKNNLYRMIGFEGFSYPCHIEFYAYIEIYNSYAVQAVVSPLNSKDRMSCVLMLSRETGRDPRYVKMFEYMKAEGNVYLSNIQDFQKLVECVSEMKPIPPALKWPYNVSYEDHKSTFWRGKDIIEKNRDLILEKEGMEVMFREMKAKLHSRILTFKRAFEREFDKNKELSTKIEELEDELSGMIEYKVKGFFKKLMGKENV